METRTAIPPSNPVPTAARRPLPRSVEQLLGWLSPYDYNKVETVLCGLPLTKELVLAARFLDAVWAQARNAEYRVSSNRITGAEMDLYHQRFERVVKEIVAIGVELAGRANLTEITQRHRTVLNRHGFTSTGQPKVAPIKGSTKDSGGNAPALSLA